MSKIYTPEHRFPLEHVGISASQNVDKSQERADEKEANSIKYYVKNGLMPSLKFKRTVDAMLKGGYDENKAVFPVYEKVPLFAITTLAALESGMLVSVTGSREVGMYVRELQRYYKSIGRKTQALYLKWAPEVDGLDDYEKDDKALIAGNRKKLKLGNSMSRLAGSLNLLTDDAFMFVAGDIIFYDYPRVAHDRDIVNHSLVIDLNGKETINPPVPRNYYHRLRTAQGAVHFKEPNVWIISSEFNLGLADDTYENAQKGGFGLWAFLKMAGRNMIKNPYLVTVRDFLIILGGGLEEGLHFTSKKLGFEPPIPKYYQEDLESMAKFLNMSPVRVKAEHDDYLRLKDVDALHDYIFIRRLLEGHIDDVFPRHIAEKIKGFAEHLRIVDVGIPDFAERINDKIDRVQAILYRKRFDYKLEKPFDNNGEFVAEPREDENLEVAVERSKVDLERYYSRAS